MFGRGAALLFVLLAPSLSRGLAPIQDPDSSPFGEIPHRILKRFDELARTSQWREVFDLYDQILEKFPDRMAWDPGERNRYVGCLEALQSRLRSFPGAVEAFRDRYDGSARAAFLAARESRDWTALEQAAERYILAGDAYETLEAVAHHRFLAGEIGAAAVAWRKLLQYVEADHPLYAVLLCRLATAYALLGDADGVARLRTVTADDRVLIGDRLWTVSEYLGSLEIKTPTAPLLEPSVRLDSIGTERPVSLATDVLLGACSLVTDAANLTAGVVRTRGMFAQQAGREYVLVTTGRRVVAIDPTRGDGKLLEKGVYWRYPESGPIRGQATASVQFGAVFGLTLDGETVFVTLMGDTPPVADQRRQTFDGARRVVALDLRTGTELWDTAKLRVQQKGRAIPILETLPFGDRDFAFTAPPLIRDGHVYLPVSTHPVGEREAHVICLDARTGRPVWSTFAASSTQAQRAYTHFPTISVEDGSVVVAANFGAVLCLDARTGRPRWASTYASTHGPVRPRLQSAPILHGGRLYILAQDCVEPLSFDALTGRRLSISWSRVKEDRKVDWNATTLLTEIEPGLLVASGAETWILDLVAQRSNPLYYTDSTGQAPPTLIDDRLYVLYRPSRESQDSGGIAVYDRRSWKVLGRSPWPRGHENADALIAGDYVILQQRDVKVYTSAAALERRLAPHVDLEPPRPDVCLRLGNLLYLAGARAKAIRAYERFLWAAEGDPARSADVQKVKSRLTELGATKAPLRPPDTVVNLGPISVNTPAGETIAVEPVLVVNPNLDHVAQAKEGVESRRDLLRDRVLSILSRKTSADLAQKGLRESLASEIRKELNALLGRAGKGQEPIERVTFEEFRLTLKKPE